MLKRNLLFEEKKQKSYCQNATALSSALACPEMPASCPTLRSVQAFFVRSVLKKMRTLIHKKNAVIFIHLISSKLYIERNNNKKLCKIKKKRLSPALETLLNERKKNPVLMKVKKNLFVFFAHIF